MLLPGVEVLRMAHGQCLALLKRAEDTFHLLPSTLKFLIYAVGQRHKDLHPIEAQHLKEHQAGL